MPTYDVQKMRRIVHEFEFYSKPSNANSSGVCTVADINKVIKKAAKMMYSIIDEIEHAE